MRYRGTRREQGITQNPELTMASETSLLEGQRDKRRELTGGRERDKVGKERGNEKERETE